MAQLIYNQLTIDGSEVLQGSNYSVNLHQPMAGHHKLTITCPTESLEDSMGNFAARAKQFIGSKISLIIGSGRQFGQLESEDIRFVGIVTNVNINKHDGSDGLMIISAYSPTILLSHGKDSQSFERKTLSDIITEATKEYPKDVIKFDCKPKYKNPISYTVQYKEDDFNFIRRLAARYGEWFYYDGQTIQFGHAGAGNAEINYGVDLHSFDFGMQTRPQDHTFFAYDSLQAIVHDSSMRDFKQSVNNPYINHVTDVSSKIFSKKPQSIYNHSLLMNGVAELDTVAKLKAGHALNTVFFSGVGESTAVQLGDAVKVYGTNIATKSKEFYGRYIITEVTHSIDTAGEYENYFSGVPIDIKVPPYFNEDAIPICEDQYAIVKDNNDPDGLSRIRVQFPWQIATNQLTPWIRVTTPYAGNGKGMHILPELEEEVLVSFESSCAEKPVVIGTMFHGSGKSGHGGAGNYLKGLQTVAGQRLQMNDDDGSLYLQDNGGNSIKMDGSGNLNTSVDSNSDTKVGSKSTENVGSKKNISVGDGGNATLDMDSDGNVNIKADTELTITVGESKFTMKKDGTITINGKNLGIEAEQAEIVASKAAHYNAGKTKIDGGDVFIN